MDSSNPVRKVFESEPGDGMAKQVNENVTTLGIRNWRQAVIAHDIWRHKLAEAKT